MFDDDLKNKVIEGLITGKKMPLEQKDYARAYHLVIKSLFLMDKNPTDSNEKEIVDVLNDALDYVLQYNPKNPMTALLKASFKNKKVEKSLVWSFRQGNYISSPEMDEFIRFCVKIPEVRLMMAKGLIDENKRHPWFEERPVKIMMIKRDDDNSTKIVLNIGQYRGR